MKTENVVLNPQSEEVIKFWQDNNNTVLNQDCEVLDIVIDDLLYRTNDFCGFDGKTKEGNESKALELFELVRNIHDIKMRIKGFKVEVKTE